LHAPRWCAAANRDCLYISGTASITGHESRHPDDPAAQLEETLVNIKALIDSAATEEGIGFDGFASLRISRFTSATP